MSVPKTDASWDLLNYVHEPKRTEVGVSVAALKATTTRHLEMLALPIRAKPKIPYLNQAQRAAIAEQEAALTWREKAWLRRASIPPVYTGVNKAALYARRSARIDVMAYPRLNYLSHNKRHFKLETRQQKAVEEHIAKQLQELEEMYPPGCSNNYTLFRGMVVHKTCTGMDMSPGVNNNRPRYICQLSRSQRKAFRKRMKQIGMPKKITQPSMPDRGPKKKAEWFQSRLKVLAKPTINVKDIIHINPFAVKKTALTYVISDRVDEISKPKPTPAPAPLYDEQGNEIQEKRVMDSETMDRILVRAAELAVPKFVKKKAVEDVKEDPFAVVKRALTAWCSPRIKEIAEPARKK